MKGEEDNGVSFGKGGKGEIAIGRAEEN